MLRNFSAAGLALAACAAVSLAQTHTGARAAASAQHSTSVGAHERQLGVASGTRLTGELQSTLDVSKARVGDRVVLRTTEAVKQNGRTILKKGAQLVGRVSDVQRRAGGSVGSAVTVVFDTLQSGSLSAPISVTIDSVTQAAARARAGDEDLGAEAGADSRTSARASSGNTSSGGGLLGGVTGAVGNTVGGVTNAAGDVVGSTAETAGGVARGAGNTLGRIQVTQSAGLSADGGSTLSLAAGNLRLEKGTAFRLTVQESARVGNER